MICLNTENQVVIIYKDNEYCLKKGEEYQKFVLLLTDPKIELEKTIFDFDQSVTDPRFIGIFTKYKDFFETFLNTKAQIIEEAEKNVEEQLPKEVTTE